ncbi:hypothetical protein [Gilvimarinus algae]|uniref:Uncharacterized protein n=1 Tax=Gilvimarinus algae TaxID=3058037 RepID=A0ABT8TDK3_9GAMM|nr:hypothetical protein [Gilvimarinus sp. SDUM040014]MDO3381458.1 hypothetical protein [Gilvimarinus sp. SDUM040014]
MIQAASPFLANPPASPLAVRGPERAELNRVNAPEPVSRPVVQTEPARRESADSRKNIERIDGELLQADGPQLDALVELFLQRAGERSGSESEQRADDQRFAAVFDGPRQASENSGSEAVFRSSLGFGDLRSALSYWESLQPQREDTSNLPAPIAAYRQVESGPTPTLGLSAYA